MLSGVMFKALIASLEKRARKHGPICDWLARAGVAESTFYRWKNGDTKPSTRTLERLEKALVKKKGGAK